jgi:hypothetical protein
MIDIGNVLAACMSVVSMAESTHSGILKDPMAMFVQGIEFFSQELYTSLGLRATTYLFLRRRVANTTNSVKR